MPNTNDPTPNPSDLQPLISMEEMEAILKELGLDGLVKIISSTMRIEYPKGKPQP